MIKIVVPVSGGKDSEACLKKAIEVYGTSEVIGLFCDTRWEHPITYAHILNRFPSSMIRFCTDRLKIQPSRIFYRDLMRMQGGFEVWCGMRSGESTDREKRYKGKLAEDLYFPHEINPAYPKYLGKGGVKFRLPILDWSTNEVFAYLQGVENPLYAQGFDRVGCFPCLASTSRNINNAYEFDEFGASQKRIVIQLEKDIHKHHQPSRTDQMCMFCHI